MKRVVQTILAAQTVIDDGDMLLYRALPSSNRNAIGPFVFVDHYRAQTTRGIGDKPHPHAGIEVISYLLEGSMEHRDSMGFRDRLGPGDAQWIRAGSGILHAEQPFGGRHGLQMWTSLPPAQKFAQPAYASWRVADIPRVDLPGARVTILAGVVAGAEGPMKLATQTTFAHVRMEPGASVCIPVDADQEIGLYVLEGQVTPGQDVLLSPGTLALLTPGSEIELTATDQTADIAIIGGAPAEGPIMFYGPFVMDSAENIARAKRDYVSGKMGRLDGVPF